MDTTIRTDVAGNPIVERRHWSFSVIEKFVQCPKRLHAYDIAKVVAEPSNPQMNDGLRVHKQMAALVSDGTPLPPEIAHYAKWLEQIPFREDTKVRVEQKYACTFELEPCDYFSRIKKVWLRTVADLIVINTDQVYGEWAISWDWKTGQQKDERYNLLPEHFQLKLVALTIFLNFPKVTSVTSAYIYLPQGEKVEFTMARADLRDFIPVMYDVVSGYQQAVRTNQFPARPSGLCKRHCGVTACQYHGIGSH